jgi:hypothetical protein
LPAAPAEEGLRSFVQEWQCAIGGQRALQPVRCRCRATDGGRKASRRRSQQTNKQAKQQNKQSSKTNKQTSKATR